MPLIKDTLPFVYSLQESAGKPFIVRGVFQRAEAKNYNGRVYPRKLWEKILADKTVVETLNRRRMLGELDHPSDGEIKLSRVSHLVTSLEMLEDGTVIGVAEVLDTPGGQVLKELFRSRAEVGISSRGSGSVLEEDGSEVVQEDFELQTFDFVSQPSTFGAYPKVVMESKNPQEKSPMPVPSEQTFRALRTEASNLLSAKVSLLTEDARASLRDRAEDLTVRLTKFVQEDPGYTALVSEVVSKLNEKRRAMESAVAPPPVDKLVAAAEVVIGELARQVSARERAAFTRGSRRAALVNEKLRVATAKSAALERKFSAACAVGEELLSKVASSSVREAISKLLSSPSNAHLRPMRAVFEKCKSVKAVTELAQKLAASKTTKTRTESATKQPLPSNAPKRLSERVSRPTAVETSQDPMVKFLTGRYNLRY